MKRYLSSAIAAGLTYALLGPIFVAFALDETLRAEFANVLADFLGSTRLLDETGESDWGVHALLMALGVLFGFLTMAVFALLVRRRGRFASARLTGLVVWLPAYVILPVVWLAMFGLSTALLFLSIGYGLVETQVATHVGALAWGGPKKQ